ncbi:cation diffusion facilitator transporter family protein, partial [Vibrio parahaemolyticus V-223/04]
RCSTESCPMKSLSKLTKPV